MRFVMICLIAGMFALSTRGIWWMEVTALLLAFGVVCLQDHRLAQARAEIARYRQALELDPEPQSEPDAPYAGASRPLILPPSERS